LFRRILMVFASLLLAGGGSLFIASPASAGDTAYNQRTQELAIYPNTGNSACVSRRIWLQAGNYHRKLFMRPELGADPKKHEESYNDGIYLGTGWYTWTDCLQGTWDNKYRHQQSLDPDNPAWVTSTQVGIGNCGTWSRVVAKLSAYTPGVAACGHSTGSGLLSQRNIQSASNRRRIAHLVSWLSSPAEPKGQEVHRIRRQDGRHGIEKCPYCL
jgi:hypothetical protein